MAETTFASRRHVYRRPKAAAIAAGASTPAPGASVVATAAPRGKAERVPESLFKNGKPEGIFVGTSLLSGKAICLMFLSGGRITRAIPQGGLEDFYCCSDFRQALRANASGAGGAAPSA